ncbi:NUDIX hydrolase (ADP-ribose pyrophosphatase) [Erwinia billingiae Eb661]|jgi:nudix-type nucleoside diphosphatase (YffH/AdpP family)|uniref:GDP-mannose pyrophosphatase n=1 Tax=Erwinia billingiae (strain Eb661) TaxID=634500 RepID=D8MPE3_ERWBE|nr:NUDIX hydrolase [Erwinia billingiae]MBN7121376.1 GDP-mannose pyrophosphatase [Erwinia billingiae]CAX58700.1 NUDIX hydrolase (ADP-ribose pyrophosphatase) [Erwinia billingiae Eb661]
MQPKRAEVRIVDEKILSDDWYSLKKYTFDIQRRNGDWQQQTREVYDRGNGATVLLYNRERETVILTRQFRFPVFMNGHEGYLIEAAAGLLDNMDPERRIKAEAEEETGFKISTVQKVFEAYMSPGSVTEKLYFYIAEYDAGDKTSAGGGIEAEGEDIEVLEMPLKDALAAVENGLIVDGKTIMLLYHVALKVILRGYDE